MGEYDHVAAAAYLMKHAGSAAPAVLGAQHGNRPSETRMCLGRAHRHRRPLDYLHGVTVDTDWQPGARVTMALTDQWRLTGEVLAAERPHRLFCTLDDPPGSPSVYVTWELHRTGDETIIRLNVDEPWPFTSSTEDLGSAWLPVLSGLVKHL